MAYQAFYRFIAKGLINILKKSTNVRFYLSYDIQDSLKSHFWREMVKNMSVPWTSLHSIRKYVK